MLPSSLLAQSVFPDREAAFKQIDLPHSKQLATQLQLSLADKPAARSIEILQAFTSRQDQSITATEYALWQLATSARQQAGDSLDPEVLSYLINYSSLSRVEHPENPNYSLPLFNIRATATGALALRERQQDLEVAQGMAQQPNAFLTHYLLVKPLSQAALRQAAIDLPAATIEQLLALGMQQLNKADNSKQNLLALIDLNSELAFESGNINSLATIIATEESLRLPYLITRISTKLPAQQSKDLLYQASKLSPQIAAIAINELARFAATDTAVYHSLITWLGDPQLGSAAALALSTTKQPQLKSELLELSTTQQKTTSMNAQLALDLLAESTQAVQP